jgi:trans-aconitate 2-methyltransferase
MAWNPQQYLKFSQPRLRPALDLLARIDITSPKRIYDLGCGTGNITRLLAERWSHAKVTGVDSSSEMLTGVSAEAKNVEWTQQSLADWRAHEPAGLIFSNAALHWLPDHASLFPKLADDLISGGILAVQMPRNFLAPSHTLIYETARAGAWRNKLEHLIRPPPVAEPQFYYSLLKAQASQLDIWETEYLHELEGPDAVKEWTKGTWLKGFLDALDEPQRSEFEADYARRVAAAYPPLATGETLFPFKRLFVVMTKR